LVLDSTKQHRLLSLLRFGDRSGRPANQLKSPSFILFLPRSIMRRVVQTIEMHRSFHGTGTRKPPLRSYLIQQHGDFQDFEQAK
jgi:hypothetical protein